MSQDVLPLQTEKNFLLKLLKVLKMQQKTYVNSTEIRSLQILFLRLLSSLKVTFYVQNEKATTLRPAVLTTKHLNNAIC